MGKLVQRVAATAIAVSAAGGAGWMASEGFAPSAMIPRPGDRPTVGYGSTFYADGSAVRMGDAITRSAAQDLALGELDGKYGQCVRASLGSTPVSQVEFDQASDFAGNYGCKTWASSSMATKYKAGDYDGACFSYLLYNKVSSTKNEGAGWTYNSKARKWQFNCATPGNRVCGGVWTRSQKRFAACSSQ